MFEESSPILFLYFCSGDVARLQEKLLASQYRDLKPDVNFLEALAAVVGPKWPSLATFLSLTGEEIEEVRKEGGSPHSAFWMLEKWSSREDATYAQLCQILKMISLFQ